MCYKYFENRECEFYPCHKSEHINCLFCFCPLYNIPDCGGSCTYITSHDGRRIKDCTDCLFPHRIENYDAVIKKLNR
ncbi:MAG: metal-binding protein [Clostridiales bacterium]|nr:metal-binding protein [Clostridiales bacterium]